MPVLQYFLDKTVKNNKPNSLGQKHQNRCILQQLISGSGAAPVSESFLSGSGKSHDTVAVELRRTAHLANTLGPAPRKHPWPRPVISRSDANQHNLQWLCWFASLRDMTGRGQGCLRGAGPRVFARCAVLRSSTATVSWLLPLPDKKLSLTGAASLAEMSFCKTHRFLVCRSLASVKDCNRCSLDVGYSLWLRGLLLPGPGLPPGDGLVV